MRTILASLALSIGFIGPSLAADMPVKARPAPVAAPVFTWTGFYAGGNIGGAWLDKSVTEIGPGNIAEVPGTSFDLKTEGVTGGVQIGYNWQTANWVWGVEADFNAVGGLDKRIQVIGPEGDTDDILRGKVDWFATFRGRLGFAATPNWLLYVTGGGAVAKLTNEYGDTDNGILDPDDAASVARTRWGWTVGGGLEYALARNWSAKAEYLYMDFGSFTAGTVTPGEPGNVRFHDRMHVARVGLNYRFGR